MQNSSLRLLQLHHCSIQNMQNQLPIDALSAGVGLGMVNPKAALESKVTAAVAPKFHRQPRLRGHPLHTIRSQEPGPGLSPAPMIIVAFFSSGLLWMANPKMALGSKAVVAEVSSRPSRWGRRWSSSKKCFDRPRRLVIQLRARRLVVALKMLFGEGKEVP